MEYLPLHVSLRQRPCVVIGGGLTASRKVSLLCQAQARVTVVAPELCPLLEDWQQQGRIQYLAARYQLQQLDGQQLVVAATHDPELNALIAQQAQARGQWVNVVDTPQASNFIFPAIIDRDPVLLSVSSGTQSPVLTRLLRGKLETLIPAAYGRLAQLAGQFRLHAKQSFPVVNARRRFWEQVLTGPIAELVFSGRERQAEQQLDQALSQPQDYAAAGEVYVVGAGPGDPDLLTLRALRLMQQADVVLYDRLVSNAILDKTRRDAQRIYVGKRRDKHAVPQQDLNAYLVELAQQGHRVLRLKGGDPFIFGRGGEELEQLAAAGVSFQVVPGVTAAAGCAAYAGIPLTHRDYSQSVSFVTGHLKDGSVNLDWDKLVKPNHTLVIYMGLVGLAQICQQLIQHGMSAQTPIALVQQGTTPKQQVWTSTLASMPEHIQGETIQAPTLIIVGQVVALREQLDWFAS